MEQTKSKREMLVATESFHTEVDGDPLFIKKGDLVRANHAVVKGREIYFEPASDRIRPDLVEEATAAPGVKRGANG